MPEIEYAEEVRGAGRVVRSPDVWVGFQDQPRVVGIESGYEKDFLDPTRTVFAGGQHLVNLVNYGWANWG